LLTKAMDDDPLDVPPLCVAKSTLGAKKLIAGTLRPSDKRPRPSRFVPKFVIGDVPAWQKARLDCPAVRYGSRDPVASASRVRFWRQPRRL